MQVPGPGPSLRGWVVSILLALLGVAACEESTPLARGVPVVVAISPSGTIEMTVGDAVQLQVKVQHASNPAVRYTSSAPDVAVVSESGMVSARTPGITSIVATSLQDTTVSAAVNVRVVAVKLPGDASTAAVLVESVVDSLGRLVPSDRLQGRVAVRLALRPGGARTVAVLVGERLVCTQPLTERQTSATCEIDTAAFDTATGVPVFRNGAYRISARLLGAADNVLASASTDTFVLANANTIRTTVSAERTARDALDQPWFDGAVTVHALPVLYSGGQPVGQMTFTYVAPGGDRVLLTDSDAPFRVTFPEAAPPSAGGLGGVTDPSFRVVVSSLLGTSASGPSAVTALPFRYDNGAPVGGTFVDRGWVGSEFAFRQMYQPPADEDAGVGGVTHRFFAGEPALSAGQLVANGKAVIRGKDLAASASTNAYRLAALVCDALENCASLRGPVFGVDLIRPVLTSSSGPGRLVNPTTALSLSVRDRESGVGASPYLVAVTRLSAVSSGTECGPVADGVRLPGTVRNGECVADTVDVAPPIPRTTPGYYTYTISAQDLAGNRSVPVTLQLLVDRSAPQVQSLVLPSRLLGGRELSTSVSAVDNLDLSRIRFNQVFTVGNARFAVSFAPDDTVGISFDERLQPSASVAARAPFVRTLTFGLRPSRPTILVDSIGVLVTDAAGNEQYASRPVPPSSLESVSTADPFPEMFIAETLLSSSIACTLGCLPNDVTSTSITAKFTAPTAARVPFQRVYFYLRQLDGSIELIGSSTRVVVNDTGVQAVFTYSINFVPHAALSGTLSLFAIGVNQAGAGLRTENATVRFFTR